MTNPYFLFKIAHITDLHLGQAEEFYLDLDLRGRFLAVLEQVISDRPNLLILGGDYSLHDPDPTVCYWLRGRLDETGIPYLVLSGNHDSSGELINIFNHKSESYGELYFSHQAGGFQHLVLDSSLGKIDLRQLNWLRNALQNAQKPVVWIHHPPTLMSTPFMDGKHALRDRDSLLEILHGYEKPLSIFCGHYHAALTVTKRNLSIHTAPPTSFFISPAAHEFKKEEYPPGYQLVLLSNHRKLVVPRYVTT